MTRDESVNLTTLLVAVATLFATSLTWGVTYFTIDRNAAILDQTLKQKEIERAVDEEEFRNRELLNVSGSVTTNSGKPDLNTRRIHVELNLENVGEIDVKITKVKVFVYSQKVKDWLTQSSQRSHEELDDYYLIDPYKDEHWEEKLQWDYDPKKIQKDINSAGVIPGKISRRLMLNVLTPEHFEPTLFRVKILVTAEPKEKDKDKEREYYWVGVTGIGPLENMFSLEEKQTVSIPSPTMKATVVEEVKETPQVLAPRPPSPPKEIEPD